MTDAPEKFPFASPEWFQIAQRVLVDLVAEHGTEGESFSICEIFADAPEGLIGPEPTTAAWYFSIDGKNVEIGEGTLENADKTVTAPYAEVLPLARTVYTPEMIAKSREAQANDPKNTDPPVPPYLVKLHNDLALVTE